MTVKAKICLNMIVKNEMANLPRCLASVAPYIDCYVIGDTGSVDGTQDFIRSFFDERGIPGEVHSFPFVNFAQARNAALDCARGSSLEFDYILLTDADMELVVEDPDFAEKLDRTSYRLMQYSGVSYWNLRMLPRDAQATYLGVTHEYLDIANGDIAQLDSVHYIDHATGSNRVEKYDRDVRLLEGALAEEADEGMRARYTFYLANTLRDAGRHAEALDWYERRSNMAGWAQEVYVSLFNIGRMHQELKADPEVVLAALEAATDFCPTRAEALHDAARYCRLNNLAERGYAYAVRGLEIAKPHDALFVYDWVYDYGLMDEAAINAFWAGRYEASLVACDLLLSSPKTPPEQRERILKNKDFALAKLAQGVTSDPARCSERLQAARELERVNAPRLEVLAAYDAAHRLDPKRAEALHGAARYCRNHQYFERGYALALEGLQIKRPEQTADEDRWIYDYGLLDELAVSAFWIGRYAESDAACVRLISEGFLPPDQLDRVQRNREFALARITTLNPLVQQGDPSRRRFAVFTSAGDRHAIENWIGADAPRDWDLIVAYFGNNDEVFEQIDRIATRAYRNRGGKFQNLRHLLTIDPHALDGYDFVWMCDDDIIMSPDQIAKTFEIAASFDFWVCQPAFSERGKISWNATRHHAPGSIRIVNFIENTCPVFRGDKLAEFMEVYDGSLAGWGIDFWYCNHFDARRYPRFAVLDDVIVTNPRDEHKSGAYREIDQLQSTADRQKDWATLRDRLELEEYRSETLWIIHPAKHVAPALGATGENGGVDAYRADLMDRLAAGGDAAGCEALTEFALLRAAGRADCRVLLAAAATVCREQSAHDAVVSICDRAFSLFPPTGDEIDASLLNDFSISAYYVDDAQVRDHGFSACDWLALHPTVDDARGDLARWNLYFYAPVANIAYPSFAPIATPHDVAGSGEGGWPAADSYWQEAIERTLRIEAGAEVTTTPPVDFEGGQLLLLTQTVVRDAEPNAQHRFAWFDANGQFRKISRPFVMRDRGSEQALAVARREGGAGVDIVYRAADGAVTAASIEAGDVASSLETAEPLPMGWVFAGHASQSL